MLRYTIHRLLMMIPTLFVISLLIFFIIQLPPGDYLETYMAELQARGESIDSGQLQFLRETYGLDEPFHVQYAKWAWGLLHGDLGYSFEFERPVVTAASVAAMSQLERVRAHPPACTPSAPSPSPLPASLCLFRPLFPQSLPSARPHPPSAGSGQGARMVRGRVQPILDATAGKWR